MFWASRLETIGVNSASIPRKQLSVGRLVSTIETVRNNTSYRSKAVEIGELARGETGVARAVELIENHFCILTCQ